MRTATNGTVEDLRERVALEENIAVNVSSTDRMALPEASEDYEVLPIKRVPVWENPYYERLADNETNIGLRREADEILISPVTPGNTRTRSPADQEIRSDDVVVGGHTFKDDLNDIGKRSTHTALRKETSDGGFVFHNFREMLQSFYRDVESFFKTEAAQLQNQLFDRFEDVERELKRRSREIGELRVVMARRDGSSTVSRSTPLAAYEAKLETQTLHAVWVFDKNTIAKILSISLPHIVIKTCRERGSFMDKASLAFRAILFGLLASQKRSAFSTGVGKLHSDFRYSIVMNIIYNVQNNRFNRFLSQGEKVHCHAGDVVLVTADADKDVKNGDGESKFPASEMRTPQPEWLKPGYIKECDVKEARTRVETVFGNRETTIEDGNSTSTHGHGQKKRWMNVKETPSKVDIACFGALKVYRLVKNGALCGTRESENVAFRRVDLHHDDMG